MYPHLLLSWGQGHSDVASSIVAMGVIVTVVKAYQAAGSYFTFWYNLAGDRGS